MITQGSKIYVTFQDIPQTSCTCSLMYMMNSWQSSGHLPFVPGYGVPSQVLVPSILLYVNEMVLKLVFVQWPCMLWMGVCLICKCVEQSFSALLLLSRITFGIFASLTSVNNLYSCA